MWTVWSVFIAFYHFMHSASNVSSCKNETACNNGFKCQDSGCKECIKCSLLFRKGSVCESDFNNCGPCLPGYKEISKTSFSNIIKPCRPEKHKSNLCTNDEDCPIGSYCYEKFCAVCFDCTLLNKLPPSNGCAKDFNKCGFCIDGFYELPVTADSNIKPCERKIPELKNLPKLVLSFSNMLPFCILIVFAAVVIKLLIKKNKEKNDAEVANCQPSLSPSAPPLFVSEIPGSILCEEKTEKSSTVAFVSELKQQANTARVFKQPHALYYFAEEGVDDASDQSNDSSDDGISPPQRSEQEETCFPSIFIHRYAEMRDHISPTEEVNESTRDDRQFSISVDNVDSQTPVEDAPKSFQRTHDSSPKS